MPKSTRTEPGDSSSRGLPTLATAVKIALWYFGLGSLWIFGSGWLLHHLVPDGPLAAWLELLKGWGFVSVTAWVLGWVLNRLFRDIRQAAQKLKEHERRLRLMGDNLPDGFVYQYTVDPDGQPRFTHISAGVERVLGLKPAEVLRDGRCLMEQLDPEQRPAYAAAQAESARLLADAALDLRMRRPDGSGRMIHVQARPSCNAEGQVRWDGFVTDITERKRMEEALRQSEEQFRTMFELASIGMVQAHPHTRRLMRVNRKMCDLTGYSADELLQMIAPDLTLPEDREREHELFRRVLLGEMPDYQIEKRYVRKDGRISWVNVNVTLIRDAADQPSLVLGAIEDITARRLAEEERRRLSTALEQAAESIVITDLTGGILYVNPAFERISGYSRGEALGRNPRFQHSGRHDAAFYEQLWGTLKRGEVWHGRFVNQRKDGAIFEEDATISPVRDGTGKIVNYMAIKLDVTRELEFERQFRQSQKLEAIGQLAGGIAHDFNNILSSILLQVELSGLAPGLSTDLRDGLQNIHNDAHRAASLTRQLLLFSRRQVMQSRDLDLNEIVANLAKMLRRIIGEDVQLQLDLHPVPLLMRADPGMLDQVAMNLAVNARDAMPGGGRLVIGTSETAVDEALARQHPGAAPGRYVCLRVTDTGCGIPAAVLPKIFEPFFTTKEPGKGTGLGLATVFGIVQQHRGWLTVDSAPGQGTTFKVFLPALAAAPAPATVETRPNSRGGTETILLAEDDPAVRTATAAILKHHGYRVLEAASGPEALKLWDEQGGAIALLFTDLVMPGGLSGRQLAQQLRAAAGPEGRLCQRLQRGNRRTGNSIAGGRKFRAKALPAAGSAGHHSRLSGRLTCVCHCASRFRRWHTRLCQKFPPRAPAPATSAGIRWFFLVFRWWHRWHNQS